MNNLTGSYPSLLYPKQKINKSFGISDFSIQKGMEWWRIEPYPLYYCMKALYYPNLWENCTKLFPTALLHCIAGKTVSEAFSLQYLECVIFIENSNIGALQIK